MQPTAELVLDTLKPQSIHEEEAGEAPANTEQLELHGIPDSTTCSQDTF